ncbi:MAG: aminomethyl-transferring glycine dehydrogenase subunit GcvPB [Candidatus Krumholzibacteriota bacterium]|nr:aminomethyl-transferring glycine dehydrogenase subunit GcvPB [Candidatus Krumholzibacteriota bacterium]
MTKTIFEIGLNGRSGDYVPASDVPAEGLDLPIERTGPIGLPSVGEQDLVRHYVELAAKNYHIDKGMYPLGSCTMKYNPLMNEEVAGLEGFTGLHPAQDAGDVQGALRLMHELERDLCEITGMSAFTLQPVAGAHGELTGMMIARDWFRDRGETDRRTVIVPDSAHGTNPASVVSCGFVPKVLASDERGMVEPAALRGAVGDDTAVLMLTLPNTLGIFERDIAAIVGIVHDAGGLVYMDGANMNALLGIVQPGAIGIDIMHLNLHKTFSTPHGGGGPGSGPVGVRGHLADFLPVPRVVEEKGRFRLSGESSKTIGCVHRWNGNFNVLVKAWAYIRRLGGRGLREASENAIINANYLMKLVSRHYRVTYPGPCMHEFVASGAGLKPHGVKTLDVAKRLLDYGLHAPTVYFPLIVEEALMIEPVETEKREALDGFAAAMEAIAREAAENPDLLHDAPVTTPVRRLDEAGAARNPDLCWSGECAGD